MASTAIDAADIASAAIESRARGGVDRDLVRVPMQFHKDRLYIVTTEGMLTCIDASDTAIQAKPLARPWASSR